MKYKWLMFLILMFSSISVGISQLKIVAVMEAIAKNMAVSTTGAAWLMSVFTVAGIALAIPGAAIMKKTGPKNLLLGLMACLVAGNILGAISGSFVVMLISRVIEGISYAMIIMVGIEFINVWFNDGGAGIATGFFNTFAAIANFVAMNASIPITNAFGLKSLWWSVAIVSAICFVLVLIFIKESPQNIANQPGVLADVSPTIGEALKNAPLLLMCLLQFCVAFVLFGFITCYPQIFNYYGLSPETANFYSSLNGLFGIPVCIICGLLVEKTGKPFLLAIIGAIGCIGLCFSIPYLGPSTYIIHVIISAICPGGLVMTSVFCIVPQLAKRPALIGYSMSFVNLLYFIGVFCCTPLILGIAGGAGGWKSASLLMTAVSLMGLVFTVIAVYIAKKQNQLSSCT